MVQKTPGENLSPVYSGADFGCLFGGGGAGLVKGSAGFVNLKPFPIRTSRRCRFEGREWNCPGCFPREPEGQIWLE
jgi:hypothetical protein